MDHIISFDTFIELLLGISLSAAVGFRVFVPFLVLSFAAVVGHIDLPTNFDWLESSPALIVLALACALEIGGYFIPWFDHALDFIATPLAIVLGTFIVGHTSSDLSPVLQWTLAIIAGGGTAALTKGLMNLLRGTSTAMTGGLTNPILSTIELIAAIALTLLAITLPLVAGGLVIALLSFALYKVGQFLLKLRSRLPESNTPIA
ncbi:DUF4126 domain-containing protein [Phormidium sp. CLA17]|uniref:DUF4126 domain-containing protein n=1 Tax=Leptolyngbya sp. Cla-17 TaxID=2803751 RepID=UPI0014911FF6|nr:DUF4126 domain-containing protein [Leptolyngbya sp. Cla-17]MBM0743089.1 DUF4126 domain-containing protein [Leptolyngbya sp. Cla-17]